MISFLFVNKLREAISLSHIVLSLAEKMEYDWEDKRSE